MAAITHSPSARIAAASSAVNRPMSTAVAISSSSFQRPAIRLHPDIQHVVSRVESGRHPHYRPLEIYVPAPECPVVLVPEQPDIEGIALPEEDQRVVVPPHTVPDAQRELDGLGVGQSPRKRRAVGHHPLLHWRAGTEKEGSEIGVVMNDRDRVGKAHRPAPPVAEQGLVARLPVQGGARNGDVGHGQGSLE